MCPAIGLRPPRSVPPRRLSRLSPLLTEPLQTPAASVHAPVRDSNPSEPVRSPALQELPVLPPILRASGEARFHCPARSMRRLCCAVASTPPLRIARSPRRRFLRISPAIAL